MSEWNERSETMHDRVESDGKGLMALSDRCEELGWSVNETIDDDTGIHEWELGQYSPAGEDFWFHIEGHDKDEMLAGIQDCARDFDVSDHARLNDGTNGAPDLEELIEDAQAIKGMLDDLAEDLNEEPCEEAERKRYELREWAMKHDEDPCWIVGFDTLDEALEELEGLIDNDFPHSVWISIPDESGIIEPIIDYTQGNIEVKIDLTPEQEALVHFAEQAAKNYSESEVQNAVQAALERVCKQLNLDADVCREADTGEITAENISVAVAQNQFG